MSNDRDPNIRKDQLNIVSFEITWNFLTVNINLHFDGKKITFILKNSTVKLTWLY